MQTKMKNTDQERHLTRGEITGRDSNIEFWKTLPIYVIGRDQDDSTAMIKPDSSIFFSQLFVLLLTLTSSNWIKKLYHLFGTTKLKVRISKNHLSKSKETAGFALPYLGSLTRLSN